MRDLRELLWRPDGVRVLVTLGTHGTIWDATTGKKALEIDGLWRNAGWSPDGRRIASSAWRANGSGQEVVVWHADTGARALTLSVDEEVVATVLFSPDGTRILAASSKEVYAWPYAEARVRLWDAANGTLLHTLPHVHDANGRSAAFTPDGKWVITQLGYDPKPPGGKPVALWSVETGERRPPFSWQTGPLEFVRYSRDSMRLLACEKDIGPALYAVDDESLLARFPHGEGPGAREATAASCIRTERAFSPP